MEILDFVCSKGEFLGRGTATTLALRGAGKGKFTAFCGSRSLNISVDLFSTLFEGFFEPPQLSLFQNLNNRRQSDVLKNNS